MPSVTDGASQQQDWNHVMLGQFARSRAPGGAQIGTGVDPALDEIQLGQG